MNGIDAMAIVRAEELLSIQSEGGDLATACAQLNDRETREKADAVRNEIQLWQRLTSRRKWPPENSSMSDSRRWAWTQSLRQKRYFMSCSETADSCQRSNPIPGGSASLCRLLVHCQSNVLQSPLIPWEPATRQRQTNIQVIAGEVLLLPRL